MATTTLSVEDSVRGGLSVTFTAIDATDTYKFANDGRTILFFENTGSEATITVVTPVTVDGQAVADRTLTVPATTGQHAAGIFPTRAYNDSDGNVSFTNDIASGVSVAVVRI